MSPLRRARVAALDDRDLRDREADGRRARVAAIEDRDLRDRAPEGRRARVAAMENRDLRDRAPEGRSARVAAIEERDLRDREAEVRSARVAAIEERDLRDRARDVACAHCGLPVPASLVREGDATQFCCAGCRQVYTLVREWGLDQYYRLVQRQGGDVGPARVTGRSFEDFDNEAQQRGATEKLADDRRRTRFYLEGVHCAACVWLVEKLPAVLHGVEEVRLNLGTAVAEVTWRPADTRLSAIARALDRLGYTPHLHRASGVQSARRTEDRAALARLGVATACAMNLMFLHGALYAGAASGMASPYETFFRGLSLLVATPVMFFCARPFFRTALAGLRARIVHIDLPVAIALSVAFVASAFNAARGSGPLWFDSLAMLVASLLGARQLQRSAQRAALERADSLRGVAFLEFARKLTADGGANLPHDDTVEVPLSALAHGDRVEVRSGELVPVDGVVLSGRSSLDLAVLTGESVPVPVREGDVVSAGATNLGARLVLRVEAAGEKTRVGALLQVVEDALSRKPALIQITDLLARRFVQALLVLAVLTGIGWLHRGPAVALERVVALLVVACPCALGLSVPLAVSMALMRAARAGIFIKNPDALQRLRDVDTVLLDKTGTLTEGRARVARWCGEDGVLGFARALEAQSSHAVARALHDDSANVRLQSQSDPASAFACSSGENGRSRLWPIRATENVVEVPGQGIAGRVDGHEVRVGTLAWARVGGGPVGADLARSAEAIVADGFSPVFVAMDGRVAGVAGIGDALRPDARRTVAALRARGVRVRILSGDHPDVVAHVAAQLGIPAEDAIGGLSPEAKRDIVQRGRDEFRGERQAKFIPTPLLIRGERQAKFIPTPLLMVGDGVNDAAALALADVGIAVHGGMGATIVAADVVLTREGVTPVLELLDGARRLRGVIHRNLAFSLFYNVIASGLAIAGLVSPLLAAILMPVSSLTVVLSSAATRTFARGARTEGPASAQQARARSKAANPVPARRVGI